ncbi:class I SAM-dependent DNA methyltransferase [Jatrophihabitans fulvus]
MTGVLDALPGVPRIRWREQSVEYGEQFAEVYDVLFPPAGARVVVDFLRALGAQSSTAADGFAEFGIGTGRVAVALAGHGDRVVGVDSSPHLLQLARARANRESVDVDLELGDMRHWQASPPVAVAYCVCATLSMLQSEAEQARTLAGMARSVAPGGLVVVETHSPQRVRLLHRQSDTVTFRTEIPGLPDGMLSTSRLDGSQWSLSHQWEDGTIRQAHEFSRLIEPGELVELARDHGLTVVSVTSQWSQRHFDQLDPTYVAVFRKTTR